jgi:hypothetical protein
MPLPEIAAYTVRKLRLFKQRGIEVDQGLRPCAWKVPWSVSVGESWNVDKCRLIQPIIHSWIRDLV